MKNEKNLVIEIGQLVTGFEFNHEQFGEKFYSFKIMVTRNSGDFDIIPCIVSERIYDINTPLEDIYVYVEGNIRTHNEHDSGKLLVSLFVEDMRLASNEEKYNYSSNNVVELIGFICKKKTPRMTPFGRMIADIIIATNRNYGRSDYIPVILWNKNAKYIDTIKIGTKIKITGRLQSREYLKNKQIKLAYEVSAQTIEILEEVFK